MNGKTLFPSQCNNMVCRQQLTLGGSLLLNRLTLFIVLRQFIFPGVGLGATAVRAKYVSDEMFYQGAQVSSPSQLNAPVPYCRGLLSQCLQALAACVTEDQLEKGEVFPRVSNIREVSLKVATAGTLPGICESFPAWIMLICHSLLPLDQLPEPP